MTGQPHTHELCDTCLEPPELIPAESIALTVSLGRILRGEEAMPNTATVCILALARLTGRHDWTAEGALAEEPF